MVLVHNTIIYLQRRANTNNTNTLQIIQEHRNKGNLVKLISWGQVTLIPKSHKDSTNKENSRSIVFVNIDVKNNKMLTNWVWEHKEKIIDHDQFGFIPGMHEKFQDNKINQLN